MSYRVVSLKKERMGFSKVVLASDLEFSEAQKFVKENIASDDNPMLTIEKQ